MGRRADPEKAGMGLLFLVGLEPGPLPRKPYGYTRPLPRLCRSAIRWPQLAKP